jgi:lysyl-tRNA synthetase class II
MKTAFTVSVSRFSKLFLLAAGAAAIVMAPTNAISASHAHSSKPTLLAASSANKQHKKTTTTTTTTKKEAEDKKPNKEALAKEIDASIASATKVDVLDLLQQPGKYVKQKITFTGTFNRFADIALDYKKAFRDSRDYVTFFILRPDVGEKTIPMSELKLFFPRKKSDEVMDLEPGDKIQIVGTPFSTALDEPWVDVDHIKVLQKTTKSERKHTPEF